MAYITILDGVIQGLTEHNGDKDVLKHLRTARTYTQKGLKRWEETVNPTTMHKVKMEANRYMAALVPSTDFQRHTTKMLQWEIDSRQKAIEEIGEGLEPVYGITELYMLHICRKCNGRPNNKPSCQCPAFQMLDRMQIPGWGENTECKYAGSGVVD